MRPTLREIRLKAGLTLDELAAYLRTHFGVKADSARLSRLERGWIPLSQDREDTIRRAIRELAAERKVAAK